jgi:hypothetical protein
VLCRLSEKPRGLSLLLELLLGLSLLTFVLLVVFDLFPLADRSVSLADRTMHANNLARELMENKLDDTYGSLALGAVDGEETITDHTKRRGSGLTTEFVYRVEVTQPDPAVEIKDIVVSVTWKQGANENPRPAQVRLQSSKGQLW